MRISRFIIPASIFGFSLAYLLSPEITATDIDIARTLIVHDVTSGDDLMVQLDYPGRPEIIDAEGKIIDSSVECVLEFNFTLLHDGNFDKIMLNDHIIYPIRPAPGLSVVLFTAKQFIKTGLGKWEHTGDVKLRYYVNSRRSYPNINNHSLEKIHTTVNIFEFKGNILERLLMIELQLVQIPPGNLAVKNIIMKIPETLVSKASLGPEKCTTIICSLKNTLSQMLTTTKKIMKSCSMMSHHQEVLPQQDTEFSTSHTNPVALQFLNSDRRRHKIFSFSIIMSSLIPVLAGIATGISVGILGVFLGRMINHLRSILCRQSYDHYTCLEHIDVSNLPLDYDNEKYQSTNLIPGYREICSKTVSL